MNTHIRFLPLWVASLALLMSAQVLAGKPKTEWYMKTTVAVTDPVTGQVVNDTRSGILGHLLEADAARDPFDVSAYASTVNSRAAIVFIQDESWGDYAGEYLSDYRKARNRREDWVFTVHSSLNATEVTLNWDAMFLLEYDPDTGRFTEQPDSNNTIFKKLKLVDLETGEVVKAVSKKRIDGNQQWVTNSYTFDMSGSSARQFRWVKGKLKPEHFLAPEPAGTEGKTRKAQLSSLQARQLEMAEQLDAPATGRFGAPPQ